MRDLVEAIARALVDDSDSVSVTEVEGDATKLKRRAGLEILE